jgi:hypothetical protein
LLDSHIKLLVDFLLKSERTQTLLELSLALNSMTDIGAFKISEFMDVAGNGLKSLNLHWNKIRYKGGLRIADSLCKNDILKILDLSFNLIGKWNLPSLARTPAQDVLKKLKGQPQPSAGEAFSKVLADESKNMQELIGKSWGKVFKKNSTLIHIDISNNEFCEESLRMMAKKLKKNHTLFGLHIDGSSGSVDSLGFMTFGKNDKVASLATDSQKKINYVSNTNNSSPKNKSSSGKVNLSKDFLFHRMEGTQPVVKKPMRRNLNIKQNFPEITKPRSRAGPAGEHRNASITVSQLKQSPGRDLEKLKAKENCWICEGWQE